MVDHTATARIQRLVRWLEQFKACFGHRAQLLSLRRYVQGVFSDSERKSMQAMLARVTEPVAYQAFQHFITHAPWEAERVWRRLRAVLGESRHHQRRDHDHPTADAKQAAQDARRGADDREHDRSDSWSLVAHAARSSHTTESLRYRPSGQ